MARGSRAYRIVGITLIVVALLIALYTVVAYIGLQRGRALQLERLQQERATELANQMGRAREDVANANFGLASRRLEWILEQEPEYPEARALLEEVEESLIATRNPPTDPVEREATATPAVTATAGSNDDEIAAAELQRVEAFMEEEAWEEAITGLVSLQHNYPNYERRRTDELLQEAYIAQGVDLLYGDQIELGLYYLEQAEALGDLPLEVRDQQHWAELYLAGIGYFGVDWDVSLFYFRDLCLAAPFFHDSCAKLYEALVAYGDQYAMQGEWCPAASLYEEAYRQDSAGDASDALSQKLRQARQGCEEATPTPSAPISGTTPVSSSFSLTNAKLAPQENLEER